MIPTTYLATSLSHTADSQHNGPATAHKAENARGLAALLLAASVAALAVVADQLIDTWADNHLFLAWTALWAVVFAGSLLLTGSARRLSRRAVAGLNQWARNRAQARAEARFLALAEQDPRLMAELRAIEWQAEKAALAAAANSSTLAQRGTKAASAFDSHLFYI